MRPFLLRSQIRVAVSFRAAVGFGALLVPLSLFLPIIFLILGGGSGGGGGSLKKVFVSLEEQTILEFASPLLR